MSERSGAVARFVRWQIHAARMGVAASSALLVVLSAAASPELVAAELPVPCIAGTCGPNVGAWVTSGTASGTIVGNTFTVNQATANAVLNWQSFNVSADGTVEYKQPDSSAVALNKIFQSDPSRIFGALKANGTIYLINQNGVMFGQGAQVNVGGLVASTLDITPEAVNGLLGAIAAQKPAFKAFADADGNALPSGSVQVEPGARLVSVGGQVMLVGPTVTNQGSISAPDGQVILAAGDSVYLAASQDPNLRGFFVEVGHGGTVTNAAGNSAGAGGDISAARGNVTLVGLAVNQLGRVSATTSVRQNGSIRLLAHDGAVIQTSNPSLPLAGAQGGALTLGKGSSTEVQLELVSDEKAVDVTPQPRSSVELDGKSVLLDHGSTIKAPAGTVTVTARSDLSVAPAAFGAQPKDGRLVVESDAVIDVSGAKIDLPMESNVLRVELRGSQLADSPVQRNGALRGQTVFVDIRKSGTQSDGTAWVGSPIGALAGDVSTIQKTLGERSLTGGSISLAADGAALVSQNALLDVSGGAVRYEGGYVNTSQLLGADGHVYDISQADPNRTYTGVVTSYTLTHPKWGVTETFPTFSADPRGRYEAGYVEGKDAGQVSILAPRLALDGEIKAEVTVGPYQRKPPGAIAAASLYRPVDQLPLTGSLTLGNASGGTGPFPDYVLTDVTIASGPVLPNLTNGSGGAFDALLDPLPAQLDTVRLRPDLFGADKVARLRVFSNGKVTLPESTTLSVPTVGSIALTANAVDLFGSIVAPGGSVSVTALPNLITLADATKSKLTLGATGSIDVAGRWVNDLQSTSGATGTDPLIVNGGSVSLATQTGALMDLQRGSVVDASAGAWRNSRGQISAGRGGSITISAAPALGPVAAPVNIEADLRAFALMQGGWLSITANSICIADTDCAQDSDGAFWMHPARLTSGGFSQVALASNLGGVTVMPGTLIQPRQVNLQLNQDVTAVASNMLLETLSTPAVLRDDLRSPFSLSLTARPSLPSGALVFTSSTFDAAGVVDVGHGAVIDLDPGASLNLTSSTSIFVDGRLSAPAGNIALTINTDAPIGEFLPGQRIALGDDAVFSARGFARVLTNDKGIRTGTVLDGGTVALQANRGYIVTATGSGIDVSGTQEDLNLEQIGNVAASPLTRIASNGGAIKLASAEGMLLNGSFLATAGDGEGAAGGSLAVLLDANLHGAEPGGLFQPIFPLGPREIQLGTFGSVVVGRGSPVPQTYNGLALVPTDRVAAAGFSSLSFSAFNLFDALGKGGDATPTATASIRFMEDTTLAASAAIRLNAPSIAAAPNARVTLDAAYVGVGYDDTRAGAQTTPTASLGAATFDVRGTLIDFIGSLGLDGFGTSTFRSTGDIRFRGVQSQVTTSGPAVPPLLGTLHALGSLAFQAQQLSPTTLSQFGVVMDALNPTDPPQANHLTISGVAGTPSTVLSAGGNLSFAADDIVQSGVVRAPFGSISFEGAHVLLADGSLISTSGAGVTVPFGTTQAGTDWVYQMPVGGTQVLTQSGPTSQRVSLQADTLDVHAGATIDVSGGGDLQAYEFIPGVGGAHDVLSTSFRATQFAVLPGVTLPYAPYDSTEQLGFGYQPGNSVYLSGVPGLTAGVYAILPARYALLPGAFLVQPVAGYTDIRQGQTFSQLDGSAVVSGYWTQAGTGLHAARTSGFDVRPGSYAQREAQYNLTSANNFFPAIASARNLTAPLLPRDSGRLQLVAGAQLDFSGKLLSAPGADGRGGEVDISATNLEIVNGGTPASNLSYVALDAAQLQAIGAESLLIGGLRTQGDGSVDIQTSAANVIVDEGVTLTGRDVMLAATDNLSLASGARIDGSGAAASDFGKLKLSGSGALLRLSSGVQTDVERVDVGAAGGALNLAAGSVLRATGAALIEASGDVTADATYDLAGGSLAFSVADLSLGSAPAGTSGLVLQPADLSSLGLKQLSLTSASTIDLYGSTALSLPGELQLHALGVRAMSPDAAASFSADAILLDGTDSASSIALAGLASVAGSFALDANRVVLDGPQMSVSGFGSVSVMARSELHASASGALRASGDMSLDTPLLTTADGKDFALSALGRMGLGNSTSAAAPANATTGIGGSLALQAQSVDVGTRIRMPAGIVSITATGQDAGDGISLSDGAAVDVSGISKVFDGVARAAPGGVVRLQSGFGWVTAAQGSMIDVSAPDASARAGRLQVDAANGIVSLNGALRGNGASGSGGGELILDGYQLQDLGLLTTQLAGQGFTGTRSYRQRGPGDLTLPGGVVSTAFNTSISADAGSVVIGGTIDASGAEGGSVLLAARDRVDISGSILANANGAGHAGGTVDLWSSGGSVLLADTALVNVAGGQNGSDGIADVRLPRNGLLSVTDGDKSNDQLRLGAAIRGQRQLNLEGFETYVLTRIGAADVAASSANPLYADAATFMQNTAAILQGLGRQNDTTANVLAGIEIDSPGDLTLASDWNLADWRFDGVPGVLTLRAAGNLQIQKSLSDGFDAVTGTGAFVLPANANRSWSYRLVAGADAAASNLMQVAGLDAVPGGQGNLTIAPGRVSSTTQPPVPVMVRTGNGNIDIAAAGNLVLGNRASVIYTAGVNSGAGIPLLGTAVPGYAEDGGNIRVNVGHDIVGAPTNQLVTEWLWRTGQPAAGISAGKATAWATSYQRFEENIGTLAGGNISVSAGGDIGNLSVAIASTGRQVGGTTAADSVVDITGGGRLDVRSGGSLTGGSYFVGLGEASIRAEKKLAAAQTSSLAPVVALGDATFDIYSRGDLQLATALNPFLLPQGRSQGATKVTGTFFSTYSDTSAVNLLSSGGDVTLANDSANLKATLNSLNFSLISDPALTAYPGSLTAAALSGDLSVSGSQMALWPAPRGQLELFARGNINMSAATPVTMSGADATTFLNVSHPAPSAAANTALEGSISSMVFQRALTAKTDAPIHAGDPNPVRIVALSGDVESANLRYVSKPVHIVAGRDINDLWLQDVVHANAADVSLVSAGRDLRYRQSRDPSGVLAISNVGMAIEGPGRLSLEAGRNIDLATSVGIDTWGNFYNALLPSGGAQVSMLAGIGGHAPALSDFEAKYLVLGTAYDKQLLDFVRERVDASISTKQAALAAFDSLGAEARYALCESILLAEVRAGGRAAAAEGKTHGDYSRSFLALETMFPGSTAAKDGASTANPYKGDISLLFSKIYTHDGGGISMVAPGGTVNVGLATPPAAFGISKAPSDLGIVVQKAGDVSSVSYGDFQVNESRVFAADGGNILVWSTQGNIDAGRGAKTAISAPPPTVTVDPTTGKVTTVFPAALTGSGIQALATSADTKPGDVDLYAPRGIVNAGDAGIVAGNLTIGATAVLGRDNIQVSGTAVGVPVDTGGLGASLTGASNVASGASNVAAATAENTSRQESKAPLADSALGWLDVFVEGFGEEVCKPSDTECLKRQRQQ